MPFYLFYFDYIDFFEVWYRIFFWFYFYGLGSVGSSKPTLDKRLPNDLDIPYYELDTISWKYRPNGDRIRNDDEVKVLFQQILEELVLIKVLK